MAFFCPFLWKIWENGQFWSNIRRIKSKKKIYIAIATTLININNNRQCTIHCWISQELANRFFFLFTYIYRDLGWIHSYVQIHFTMLHNINKMLSLHQQHSFYTVTHLLGFVEWFSLSKISSKIPFCFTLQHCENGFVRKCGFTPIHGS